MSKKYKRQVRKSTTNGAQPQPAVSTMTAPASRSHSAAQTVFNPDYSYVKKDLRRIGLLAGTFISILVIISFFLR